MRMQSTHPLVYVLLIWTTIISIIQIGFFAFFFTAGRNGLSPNSSAVEPQHKMQSQQPPKDKHLLGKGKMVTFKALTDTPKISWVATNPNSDLISDKGEALTIKLDGYYYLSLQVTLQRSNGQAQRRVTLSFDNKVLLEGEINTNTTSTGLLGKVQELSAGGQLEVSIHPFMAINRSESVTHLDIIFMEKP